MRKGSTASKKSNNEQGICAVLLLAPAKQLRGNSHAAYEINSPAEIVRTTLYILMMPPRTGRNFKAAAIRCRVIYLLSSAPL